MRQQVQKFWQQGRITHKKEQRQTIIQEKIFTAHCYNNYNLISSANAVGVSLRFSHQPQQLAAPPSGHFYTSLCSFLPHSISVSFSGVSLCVSVPVGSSAMLNAPLSSFPKQELICEIIYLAVYFRQWETTLLITPTLYSIHAGSMLLEQPSTSCNMCAYQRLE